MIVAMIYTRMSDYFTTHLTPSPFLHASSVFTYINMLPRRPVSKGYVLAVADAIPVTVRADYALVAEAVAFQP